VVGIAPLTERAEIIKLAANVVIHADPSHAGRISERATGPGDVRGKQGKRRHVG